MATTMDQATRDFKPLDGVDISGSWLSVAWIGELALLKFSRGADAAPNTSAA
jgi:hypothetical protein